MVRVFQRVGVTSYRLVTPLTRSGSPSFSFSTSATLVASDPMLHPGAASGRDRSTDVQLSLNLSLSLPHSTRPTPILNVPKKQKHSCFTEEPLRPPVAGESIVLRQPGRYSLSRHRPLISHLRHPLSPHLPVLYSYPSSLKKIRSPSRCRRECVESGKFYQVR